MKKTLVSAIIGLAAVASSFAQGHILCQNYAIAPYNQVRWDGTAGASANKAVNETTVQLQFFYALGNVSNPGLLTQTAGNPFTINPTIVYEPGLGHGPGGYFDVQTLIFAGWTSGTEVTVQLRATGPGGIRGDSALWQIPSGIVGSGNGIVGTSSPANSSDFFPGLVVTVPEPSAFALFGLGSAALMLFRRRN